MVKPRFLAFPPILGWFRKSSFWRIIFYQCWFWLLSEIYLVLVENDNQNLSAVFKAYSPKWWFSKTTKYQENAKKRSFTIDNQNALKKHTISACLEYLRASLKLEFVLKTKTVAHRGRRRYCFFALGRDRLRLFNDAADEGGFRGFP